MMPLRDSASSPPTIQLVEKLCLEEKNFSSRMLDFVLPWFDRTNKEIDELNILIEAYHHQTDVEQQKQQLKSIKEKLQYIQDIVPADVISELPDFRDNLHDKLFSEIQNEEKRLNPPSAESSLNAPNFESLIEGMSYKALCQFTSLLSKKDMVAIKQLYSPSDHSEEAQAYRNFMGQHSIEFLGGGNSKNFRLTHINSQKQSVIKIESRLGNPKQTERELRKNISLEPNLPKSSNERQVCYKDASNELVTGYIFETECQMGGDVESCAFDFVKKPIEKRLEKTVDVFEQMDKIFTQMANSEIAFPDAKNSNWLINQDGTLILADTKSYLPSKNNTLTMDDIWQNEGYDLITTTPMRTPEMTTSSTPIDVSPMHAYLLGKNMYQFVTGCKLSSLQEPRYFKFNDPIFQTLEGRILQTIIQGTTEPYPPHRIKLDMVMTMLKKTREIMNTRKLCHQKIEQLIQEDAQNISTYQTLRNKMNDTLDIADFDAISQKIFETYERHSLHKKYKHAEDEMQSILWSESPFCRVDALYHFIFQDEHLNLDQLELDAFRKIVAEKEARVNLFTQIVQIDQHPDYASLSIDGKKNLLQYIENASKEILLTPQLNIQDVGKRWNKENTEKYLENLVQNDIKTKCEMLLKNIETLDPTKTDACQKMRTKIEHTQTATELRALETSIRLTSERLHLEKATNQLKSTLNRETKKFTHYIEHWQKEQKIHHHDALALQHMREKIECKQSGIETLLKLKKEIDWNHIPDELKQYAKNHIVKIMTKILEQEDLGMLKRGQHANWNYDSILKHMKSVIENERSKSPSLQTSSEYKAAINTLKTDKPEEPAPQIQSPRK